MPYSRSRQDNWWKKRTKLERQLSLIALSATFFGLVLLVSLIYYRQYGVPKGVCLSTGCVQASSKILDKLDVQYDPCDDFYSFACGSFIKKEIIPKDSSSYSTFTEIRQSLEKQLRSILEEPIQNSDIHVIQAVKNYYNACMDEEEVNKAGLLEAQALLDILGGWPVLNEMWVEQSFDWIDQLQLFKENGLDSNFILSITAGKDFKNSSRRIINIDQPPIFGLGTYLLKKGVHDTMVRNYFELMVDFAVMFGANDFKASEELEDALNFEIRLAKATVMKNEYRNTSHFYNKMTLKQLTQEYGSIDWMKLLTNILPEGVKLYDEREVLVEVPNYLDALEKTLKKTSPRSIANYLFWRVILEISSFLPQRFEDRLVKFRKLVTGVSQSSPRWKKCLDIVKEHAPIMLSAAYVRKYFNSDTKAYAEEMLEYIVEAFKATIEDTAQWMDEETKARAIEKANKLIPHIAYAQELFDDNILNDMFSTIIVNNKALLQSYLNINKNAWYRLLHRLLEPVRRDDWRDTSAPIVVNAFYYRLENAMILPAAILQGAFFDKERPGYLNFGGIGSVVGHEIVHAFDDQGSQFDETGNLRNWWNPETQNAFKEKTKCFIEKFSNIVVEGVGQNVSGVRTLGENIADNGGAKQAYLAYDLWTDKYGSEKMLPGLKYTPKQLFWISAAQVWCSKSRMEYLKNLIASDTHCPDRYRVNGNFQNQPFFAKDFKCSLGSRMNPKKKCSIW